MYDKDFFPVSTQVPIVFCVERSKRWFVRTILIHYNQDRKIIRFVISLISSRVLIITHKIIRHSFILGQLDAIFKHCRKLIQQSFEFIFSAFFFLLKREAFFFFASLHRKVKYFSDTLFFLFFFNYLAYGIFVWFNHEPQPSGILGVFFF